MSKISDGLAYVNSKLHATGNSLLSNPVATAVGGAIIGGALVGGVALAARKTKKKSGKSRKRKGTAKRRKTKKSKKRRSPRYARTAGKRKDTSTRRIRMTKNGQPYVILKSGKARFISKKSARSSRKRKGGRY